MEWAWISKLVPSVGEIRPESALLYDCSYQVAKIMVMFQENFEGPKSIAFLRTLRFRDLYVSLN